MNKILFVNTQFSTSKTNILFSQLFDKSTLYAKLGFRTFYFGVDSTCADAKNVSAVIARYKFDKSDISFSLPSNANFLSLNKNSFKLRKKFEEFISSHRIDVVYFRNCFDFAIFSGVARKHNVKTIYDSRSLLFAEVKERNIESGKFIRYLASFAIRKIEKYSVEKADFLFTVSNAMDCWMSKNFNRKSDAVIPCTCDSLTFKKDANSRQTIRAEFGWQSNKVLVYCGGAGHWQRLRDTLLLFGNLYLLDDSVRLLIISGARQEVLAITKEIKLPKASFKLVTVPHSEVPSFLSAGDIGIVLRHDNLINNVASPIKIAEYLSNSLPVICSDSIGDYSSEITGAESGFCLPCDSENVVLLKEYVDNVMADYEEFSFKSRELGLQYDKNIEFILIRELFGSPIQA